MNPQKLMRRARELADARSYVDAWRVIEPLTADIGSDIELARLWSALAVFSPEPDDRMAKAAAEIISRHSDEPSLVAIAASILVMVAETRPFDEAPLANGPARVAADTISELIAGLSPVQREDPSVAADLYSGASGRGHTFVFLFSRSSSRAVVQLPFRGAPFLNSPHDPPTEGLTPSPSQDRVLERGRNVPKQAGHDTRMPP